MYFTNKIAQFRTRHQHVGVTLIEVIFAMGVIVIGLLGLMAILPGAGHRARSSIDLNVGTALADAAFDELVAGGYLDDDRLFRADGNTLNANHSICIDPLYVASSPTVGDNGYATTVFPHFKITHDPRKDPSGQESLSWSPAQPRLLRVGFQKTSGGPFSPEEALVVVENQDDLVFDRPKDSTFNATLRGADSGIANGLPYATRLPSGEYSWFATLNPLSNSDDERYGILSVVVVHNRDRSFIYPDEPVSTPDENATDERLALVVDFSGFQGGAGGVVRLTASDMTVAKITPRNWIMLSRNVASGPVHRWYRVAGTEGDPEFDGAAGTWTQRVYLDGSDWTFTGGQTFATIVDGVVSVTERVVPIRNL